MVPTSISGPGIVKVGARASALADTPHDDTAAHRAARSAVALWQSRGPSAVTFGAVARESGLSKSLVSHHFATRDLLLHTAADTLVSDMRQRFAELADQIARLAPELRTPGDIVTYVVEHLVNATERWGTGLLEVASMSLAEASYRNVFDRIVENIRRTLPPLRPGSDGSVLIAFALGELLDHCPQRPTLTALAGLRERVGWVLAADGLPVDQWVSALIATLRSSPVNTRTLTVPRSVASTRTIDEPLPSKSGASSRRSAIVDAALDILAESDAAAVTHRLIANRACVPLAATTYHFASKLQILEAAYQKIVAAAASEARRLAEARTHQDESSLGRLIVEMIDFYVSDGAPRTLAHFHLALSACRSPALHEFATGTYENEINALRARAADHGVTLGQNAAQALKSLIGGMVLLRLSQNARSS